MCSPNRYQFPGAFLFDYRTDNGFRIAFLLVLIKEVYCQQFNHHLIRTMLRTNGNENANQRSPLLTPSDQKVVTLYNPLNFASPLQ